MSPQKLLLTPARNNEVCGGLVKKPPHILCMKERNAMMTTTSQAHGTKYTCAGCATKFYDMNKQPVVCPKCAQAIVVKAPPAPRRQRRS